MARLPWLFFAIVLSAVSAEHPGLERITAESLRANLSFLASDALEGRGTPSRGLDVASEFIASRFREAGLEPASAGDSYFQTAKFAQITPRLDDFQLTLRTSEGDLMLTGADARVRSLTARNFPETPVITLPDNGAIPAVEGKIVAGDSRRYGGEAMLNLLQSRHPALILLFSRRRPASAVTSQLLDIDANESPVIRIGNGDAYSSLTAKRAMTITLHLTAPLRKDCELKNVAGILRGSDPALRNQFIIVSAHYDHLGLKDSGAGDRIYNGADDDGSGTVSVIELANAFAAMPVHPKRSILFLTFFGEEEGLLGSYYYARHPLAPLKDTVADLNLEQLGRTDDTGGNRVGEFAFTGAGFSDLPATMESAAAAEHVKVFSDKNSDGYFARSDNYALALHGVIAHTLVVAFEFPDYHGVGDEWRKIDYGNMAKVDRAIAAGVLEIANAASPPRWSESKEAAPYREAGK